MACISTCYLCGKIMAPAEAAEWEECWFCRSRGNYHKVRKHHGHGPASESIGRENRKPPREDEEISE